jgi:hypothetical protein
MSSALVILSTGDEFCKTYLLPLLESARQFLTIPHETLVFTDTTANLGTARRAYHAGTGSIVVLRRYRTILSEKQWLSKFRNIFFIDTDCTFAAPVGDEIFSPDLTAVTHPFDPTGETGFESNPESTAYVDWTKSPAYYQGCFQGGTSEAWLAMAEHCAHQIDIDFSNGITSHALDEAHYNRYLADHSPSTVLPPTYAYLAGRVEGKPKIHHVNTNAWNREG